jgi:hypothetical protein
LRGRDDPAVGFLPGGVQLFGIEFARAAETDVGHAMFRDAAFDEVI